MGFNSGFKGLNVHRTGKKKSLDLSVQGRIEQNLTAQYNFFGAYQCFSLQCNKIHPVRSICDILYPTITMALHVCMQQITIFLQIYKKLSDISHCWQKLQNVLSQLNLFNENITEYSAGVVNLVKAKVSEQLLCVHIPIFLMSSTHVIYILGLMSRYQRPHSPPPTQFRITQFMSLQGYRYEYQPPFIFLFFSYNQYYRHGDRQILL